MLEFTSTRIYSRVKGKLAVWDVDALLTHSEAVSMLRKEGIDTKPVMLCWY